MRKVYTKIKQVQFEKTRSQGYFNNILLTPHLNGIFPFYQKTYIEKKRGGYSKISVFES